MSPIESIPTPNEELTYLHEQLNRIKNENLAKSLEVNDEKIAKEVIKTYSDSSPKELFGKKHVRIL